MGGRIIAFTLLTACLVFLPPPAVAQGPGGGFLPPNDNGTHLFRGLFHFHGIEPESTNNLKQGYDYSKLIVVVYRNPGQNSDIPRIARTALRGGGAVLFASDQNWNLTPFLPSGKQAAVTGLEVWFRPGPAGQPQAPTSRGRLVGVGRVVTAPPELNGMFLNVPNIEVESPSFLLTSPEGRPPELAYGMAGFQDNPFIRDINRPLPLGAESVAAGVGPADNPFRCVAVADTEIFSNRLLYGSGRLQNPNNNLMFANGLVQWLKGPEGRTRCLFVEKGEPAKRFDEVNYAAIPVGPPIPPVPVPTIDPFDEKFQQKVTDFINNTVQQAEEQDRLGKVLAESNERKARIYMWLAVIAAAVLYLLVRFRTLAARFKALFLPVPKDPQRLGPDTVVGSVEHRRLEILRAGEYGVPVRAYIRQLFEERGLPPGYEGDWPPRFRYNLRNRDFVRQALNTLWAELGSTKPINYARWKQLEPLLAAARAAADDDRWWIEIPSDEGRA